MEASESTNKGEKIGFDPLLVAAGNPFSARFSFQHINTYFKDVIEARTKFFEKLQISLVPVEENLVDAIWENKPSDSLNDVNALIFENKIIKTHRSQTR